ncbi:hypothetical protein A0257_03815 [Hymenobacter psoromatis]|nr:hypothetical protein A0257_03815 [Hymenobacter psoromatis]
MLISSLPDRDGSRCTLTLDEEAHWMRATWRGFIDPEEALRGAQNYLDKLAGFRCPLLLNDNTALCGPWFDSLDWLTRVWVPQAAILGLRYVAHVVQADTLHDVITETPRYSAACFFNLQVFDQVAEAEDWLHQCWAATQLTGVAGH